jgi:hypothetical protein
MNSQCHEVRGGIWAAALVTVFPLSRIVHCMLWMAKFELTCVHCEYFCIFNELLPLEKYIHQGDRDCTGLEILRKVGL